MIDTALIASCVALFVGLSGIGASLYGAHRSRRTALDLQFASERSKALVHVVQLVEKVGQAAQDRVFNLTEARQDPRDPLADPDRNFYAPRRRPDAERNRADEADALALVGAFGDDAMDSAFLRWTLDLNNIDVAIDLAEHDLFEDGHQPSTLDFLEQTMEEIFSRADLRHLIREVLRDTPQPRRLLRRSRS